MSNRRILLLYVSIAVTVSAALVVAIWRPRAISEPVRGNPLGNPAGIVDRLVFLDRERDWQAGKLERLVLDTGRAHLMLGADSDADYPRQGHWTSAETIADLPFTEMIPSWNALVPAGSGMAVYVRVREAKGSGGGDWSPWLYFGGWGQMPPAAGTQHVVRCEMGMVHTDTLVLDRAADAFQVRVDLAAYAFGAAASPALRRVAISYSGVVADESLRAILNPPAKVRGQWARKLEVPYRTQRDTPKPLRGQTCSPTSVSMVLAYWGYDRPTVENALAIYDPVYDLFGNWNRAVQRAGELGLDAWVTRFRNWDAVKAEIARGRPIIAEIQFKRGEFPAAALSHTDGHLIVVRGFTPAGDAIVNDPANPDKGNAAIYPAADLGRAWFGHGGVGYVIAGPAAKTGDATAAADAGVKQVGTK